MNFDFIAEKAEVTGSIGKITGDINMAEQVRVVVDAMGGDNAPEIGRASCRERV